MKRTMAKTTSRTVMIAITARALPSQSVGCFRGGGSTSGAPDPRPSAESRSVSAAMRSFTASLRSVIAASRSRSASSISPLALSRCLSAASRSRVSRSISVSRSRVNPLALAATSACSDRAVSSWRMASSRSGISCSRSRLAASRSRSACSRSRRAAASSFLATASSVDSRVCSASAASRLAVSASASCRSSSASSASRLERCFSSASRSDSVRLRVGRGRSGARSTTMLGATASSAWPGSGEPPFHGNAAIQSVPSSAAMSRSLRVLPDALAAGLIGVAIFAWFGHAFLNYDTFYSLVWGSDLANGRTPDYKVPVAPTPHPLAMLVGIPASLFGNAGEGVMIALVIWAAVLEARRPRRGWPVLVLLGLAGLLRPEAWLYAGAYWLWLFPWLDWDQRLRHLALVLAAPLLWGFSDLLITGDFLWSLHGTHDLAAELGRQTGIVNVVKVAPRRLGEIVRLPELIAAVIGFVIGLRWMRDRVALPAAVGLLNGLAFALFGLA